MISIQSYDFVWEWRLLLFVSSPVQSQFEKKTENFSEREYGTANVFAVLSQRKIMLFVFYSTLWWQSNGTMHRSWRCCQCSGWLLISRTWEVTNVFLCFALVCGVSIYFPFFALNLFIFYVFCLSSTWNRFFSPFQNMLQVPIYWHL